MRVFQIDGDWSFDNLQLAERAEPIPGPNQLACIIHEDSASRINSAKQVARSREKRGPPRAEGDRARCDAPVFIRAGGLLSNRQSVC